MEKKSFVYTFLLGLGDFLYGFSQKQKIEGCFNIYFYVYFNV